MTGMPIYPYKGKSSMKANSREKKKRSSNKVHINTSPHLEKEYLPYICHNSGTERGKAILDIRNVLNNIWNFSKNLVSLHKSSSWTMFLMTSIDLTADPLSLPKYECLSRAPDFNMYMKCCAYNCYILSLFPNLSHLTVLLYSSLLTARTLCSSSFG